ncbi:MAG TPA: glycosyltransferase family 2 protein [Acidimicrobiales bacterium]|nr:glycosyltransferase family 2 protein [Acidimicrobiales bacterium]
MTAHAGADIAPPVVVVVVTRDPSPERLEALLAALAEQDYPNARVLVIDAGGSFDATPMVAAALPDARVLRLRDDDGYGASANRVLDFVEGAEMYVFAHDDVVPEPDAVSALVEVAEEYDAGIVGPKLVDWHHPDRLLQVGMAVDRVGSPLPYVEPGEVDQAQHDGLRDVFVVPGAFTLVRAELFARVGGFDEAITFVHDDLSLCWRARLTGARVLVTSNARARHAEALREAYDRRARQRMADRHRLRALMMCTGLPRLAVVLPQAAVVTLCQALAALVMGRGGRAGDAVGAWWWNLRRTRSLVAARHHVDAVRRVTDQQVRRLQVRGLVGPRLQLRRLGDEDTARPSGDARDPASWTAATVAGWAAIVAVLAFGSRHMLTRVVPAVGEMVSIGAPGEMVAEWASGWRHTGLGQATAAPTVLGVLGGLSSLLGGDGMLRTALTVGLIPLGVVGAHRLLRPVGLQRAQLVAAVAYAAVPLPYNALSNGRWQALAAYAAAPWLLARLAAALRLAPFSPPEASDPGAGAAGDGESDRFAGLRDASGASLAGSGGARGRAMGPGDALDDERPARLEWAGDLPPASVRPVAHRLVAHVVAIGLTTAAAGLLVPAAPLLVLAMAAGLALGSAVALDTPGLRRLAVAGVGGAAAGLLLHLPTALDLVVQPARIGHWLGGGRADGLTALDLLRFDTGRFGSAPLGFGLVVAAVLPLLVGRSWRLAWAARAWGVALVAWGLALVQQQGWADLPLPSADVLLAPAAAGLALALGVGAAAVERDVRGRSVRFGSRRVATALAGLALVGAVVPIVAASLDGYWHTPHGGFDRLLVAFEGDTAEVPSRILWVGDPEVLPGGPGWDWRDGFAYATSIEGGLEVRDLWPGRAEGATPRLAQALDLAVERRTTRLGRLLAPMAVQYVAVPLRAAPSPYRTQPGESPDDLIGALGAQLDMVRVRVDEAIVLYRNEAFAPARALLADDEALAADTPRATQRVDLTGAFPVLVGHDGVGYWGGLPPDQTVVHASTASDRWRLSIDGRPADRTSAFGWAGAYATGGGGEATLTYEASSWFRLALVGQAALWLVAIVVVLRMRFGGESLVPARRAPDARARRAPPHGAPGAPGSGPPGDPGPGGGPGPDCPGPGSPGADPAPAPVPTSPDADPPPGLDPDPGPAPVSPAEPRHGSPDPARPVPEPVRAWGDEPPGRPAGPGVPPALVPDGGRR